LKQIVPIWKKEVWSTGEQWIGWEGQAPADLAAPKA
jgi:molybdopterin synthase catalytic subunit